MVHRTMKPRLFGLVLVLASVFLQVTPSPVNQYRGDAQCVIQCRDNEQFHYDVGKTYEYEYDMKTSTSVLDKEEESSEIKLAAKVLLTPTSQCQLSMQLREVRIDVGSASDEAVLASKLQQLPLSFSYQDGVVEEVCAAAAEDSKVLNIKRGIISTLQNSMKDLQQDVTVTETDVVGVCDTQYSAATGWGGKTITKSKDLLSCTKRHNQASSLQSMGYTVDSDIQHVPILKSSYQCSQDISGSIISSAVCEETHVLRPFVDQSSAPYTKTTQVMKFKKATSAARVQEAVATMKSSLLYDHLAVRSAELGGESLAIDIISELVRETEEEVSPKVTPKFSQLIQAIKGLSYDQLKSVFLQIDSLHREKQFFMDALPVAASGGAIRMMYDIFSSSSDLLSEVKQDLWLTSLGFTSQPTLAMIEAASKFLSGVPRKQALLGVSAMVHRYCSSKEACIESAEVRDVVRKLETLVGSSCQPTYSMDEQRMVVVLKSLGNIGRLVNSAASLERCIMAAENPMAIKLAAIDAYRRMPCDAVSRDLLMQTFKNADLDAEIRIGAYLGVMKCPSPYAIAEIKSQLESMPVNQVGSFVWTHLTNLQESQDPLKQEIRQHIAQDFLKEKFDSEARKFSRNIEGSMFYKEINAGVTWDSNLVFSTKSYLPRSMNLDLTVNLFGQAYNLFEIGGRAEGFEKYIESIFGSEGLYPEEHIQAVLKGMREQPEEKTSLLGQIGLGSSAEEAADAAVYLKMFGNDIMYEDFKGTGSIVDVLSKFQVKDLLDLKAQDIDYTKSIEFLNAEFSVPLASGLALTLGVNGKSMLRLQAGGKFNIESFFVNGDIEIDGHIKPSAVVEVKSLFAVDLAEVKSGLETISTLHTSSYVDGSIIKKGGALVQAKLNTPREKVEVFTVNSKVYKFVNDQKTPLFPETDVDAVKLCSPDVALLAYKVCSEFGYNSPLDFHTGVYLEKTDTIAYYLFSYEYKNADSVHSVAVIMDTPGSTVDRRVALTTTLNTKLAALNCELYTPFFTADVNGKLKVGTDKSFVDLAIQYNQEVIFNVDAALSKTKRGEITHIEPKITITSAEHKIVDFKGSMDINESGKNAIDLELDSAFLKTPITLGGTFKLAGALSTMNLKLATPVFSTSVAVTGNMGSKKVKLVTKYTLWNLQEQTIEAVGQASIKSRGKLTQVDALVDLSHSAYPEYILKAKLGTQVAAGHVENALKITFGTHVFDVNQLFSLVKTAAGHALKASLSVKCPLHNVDSLISLVHKSDALVYTTTVTAYVQPEFPAVIKTVVVAKNEGSHKYSADVSFTYPGVQYALSTVLEETSASLAEAMIKFSWAPEKFTSLKATYTRSDVDALVVQFYHVDYTPVTVTLSVSEDYHKYHLISLDIEKDGKHITAAGGYRYDTLEWSVFGKFVLHGVEHSAKVSWVHSAQVHKLEMDIKHQKQIKLVVQVDGFTGIEGTLQWDAAVDAAKKLTFKAEKRPAEITAQVTYPGKTVAVKVEHHIPRNAVVSVEYGAGKKITWMYSIEQTKDGRKKLHTELDTPFQGFERQSADLIFFLGAYKHRAQMTLHMAEGQSFDMVFFSGTEPQKKNLNYKVNLSIDTTKVSEYLENIAFDLEAEEDQGKYTYKNLVSWMDKEVKIDISHTDSSTPGVTEYKSQIDIKTPFHGYDRLFSMMHHRDDGSYFSSKLDATYGHISSTFETSGSYQFTRNVQSVNVHAKHTSDFTQDISMDFNFATQDKKIDVYSSVNWSISKAVALKIKGDMKNQGVKGEAMVQVLEHKFEGKLDHVQTATSNGEIAIASKLEGKLDGKIAKVSMKGKIQSSYSAKSIKCDLVFSSTWDQLDGWKLQFSHLKNADSYSTIAKVAKAGVSTEFSHQLTFANMGNWDNKIYLTSPWEYWKSIEMESTQKWSSNGFSHHSKGKWNGKELATTAYYTYSMVGGKRIIEAKGKIMAPFVSAVTVEFQHQDDGVTYTPKLTLEFAPEKKIHVDMKAQFGPKGEASIKVTLPSKYAAKAEIKYEEKKVVFAIRDSQNKHVTVTANFMKQGADKKLEIKLSSSEYKDMVLKVRDSLGYSKYVAEISFEHELEAYKAGVAVDTMLDGEAKVYFKTPELDLKVKSVYKLISEKKQVSVDVIKSEVKIMSVKLVVDPAERVYLELKSVHAKLRHASLDAFYDIKEARKYVSLTGKYNEAEAKVTGVLNQGSYGDASIEIKSPFKSFALAGIKTQWELDQHKKITVSFYKDDEKIELTVYNKHMDREGAMKAELSTPFSFLESQSVALSYKKSQNTVDYEIEVTDYLKGKGSVMFGEKYGTLTSTVTIEGIEGGFLPVVLSVSGEYDFTLSKKVAKLEAGWNGVVVKLVDIEAEAKPASGYIKIAVATPIKKWKSVKLNGEYDFVSTKKTAKIVIAKNNEPIEISVEAESKGTTADVKLSILSPFYDFQEVSVKSKFELLGAENNMDFQVTRNYVIQFETQAKINFETMLKGESSVDIKVIGCQAVSLSAQYDLEAEEKYTSVSLVHGSSLYQIALKLKSADTEKHIEISTTMHGKTTTYKAGVTYQDDYISVYISPPAISSEAKSRRTRSTSDFYIQQDNAPYFKIEVHADAKDAKVTIVTPFVNYKKVGLECSVDFTKAVKTVKVTFKLNEMVHTVAVEAQLAEKQFTGVLKSTLPGLEMIKATASWELDYLKHSVLVSVEKDEKKVELSYKGEYAVWKTSVAVKLTTPVIESATEIKYDFIAPRPQVLVKTGIDGIEQKLLFEMDKALDGNLILECECVLIPTDYYKAKIDYKLAGNSKIVTVFSKYGRHEYLLQGEFTHLPKGFTVKLETPFESLKKIFAEYTLDKKAFEYEAKLKAGYNALEVEASLEGKQTYTGGYAVKAKLMAPIPKFEKSEVEFSYDYVRDTVQAVIKIQSGVHKIKCDAELDDLKVVATIVTSFPGYETLVFGFHPTINVQDYSSKPEVSFKGYYTINGKHHEAFIKAHYDNKGYHEIAMTGYYDLAGKRQEGSIVATYSGDLKHGEGILKVTIPGFIEKEVKIQSQISDDYKEFSLFGSYGKETIQVEISTQLSGQVKCTSTIIPNIKLQWTVAAKALEEKPTVDVEFKVDEVTYVIFKAHAEAFKRLDVHHSHAGVVFASPKLNIEEHVFAIKFATTGIMKDAGAHSLKVYMEKNLAKYGTELTIKKLNQIVIKSFTPETKVNFEAAWKKLETGLEAAVSAKYNEDVYKCDIKYENEKATLALVSPYTEAIKAEAEIKQLEKVAKGSLKYGVKTLTEVNAYYVAENNEARIRVDVPELGVKFVEVFGKLIAGKSATYYVKTGYGGYGIAAEKKIDEYTCVITTPHENFKSVAVTVKYQPQQLFVAKIEYPAAQKIELSLAYTAGQALKVKLETPFQAIKEFTIEGVHHQQTSLIEVHAAYNKLHMVSISVKQGDVKSIQIDIKTPLLSVPYQFIASLANKHLEIKSVGFGSHSLTASYAVEQNGISGAFELSIPQYQKATGSFKLTTTEGNVIVNISNETHKLTYQIKEGKNKVAITSTIISSYISSNKVKVVLKYKNKSSSHQVRVNVNIGAQEHSLLFYTTFTAQEKRAVAELNTPIFNIQKFVANAAVSFNGDKTVASLRFETPKAIQSFDAALVGITQGIVKINSPWISSEQIQITYDVQKNGISEFVFAKGEKVFKLVTSCKCISALNMAGSIDIQTPFKAMSYLKIEASVQKQDGLKVKLNIDSDHPSIQQISVDAHLKKIDDAVAVSCYITTPVENYNEIRFDLLVPLTLKDLKSHIKFETTYHKYEISTAGSNTAEGFQGSLKCIWNTKEIIVTAGISGLSSHTTYDIHLKLQTPFSACKVFEVRGKTNKLDLKAMNLVAQLNDKRFELVGSVATADVILVDFKVLTSLVGYEKYGFAFKVEAENIVAAVELPSNKISLLLNYKIKSIADILVYAELQGGDANIIASAEVIHKVNKQEKKYYGSAEILFHDIKVISLKTGGAIDANGVSIQLDGTILGGGDYLLGTTFYVTVDGSEKELAVTCKSSEFEKDFIYQAEWAIMKGSKIFYLDHFIQFPLEYLGAYKHVLDIAEEKLVAGSKYAVALSGEGTSQFDGKLELDIFYKPAEVLISADCKLKAINFFAAPYSARYIAKYEDSGIKKAITLASPDKFLLEGTYQPQQKGFKSGIKAVVDKQEVVNASLGVQKEPAAFHFVAGVKPDAESINVQADLSDILSSKAYVHPKILTNIYSLAF